MKLPVLLSPRYLSLILATFLIAGLLFSRALLSIMMGAGIVLFLFPSVRNVFLEVFNRPLRYLVAGVLIYYTWLLILERDLYTLERMALHLGIISLLVLIHFMAASSERLVLLLLTAAVLSTLPTIYDMLVHEGLAALYEKGQVAYTLMDGDHQRFSIWISGCLALSWYAWLMEHKKQALYFIIYFTLFLIFLSVRTGWLFTGVVTVAGGLIWLQRQHKRVYWIRAIIGVVLLTVMAYSIPFVRKKIQYMQWEWTEKKEAERLGSSDAVRRIVNENAVKLIRENSLGWGEAYAAEVLEARNKLSHRHGDISYKWPFNQYLKWLLSAGWIMGLLPLLLIIYLLYRLYFTRNYLTAVWVLFIALTGLYESTLEMQYGFFLAVFFTGLLYLYESGLVKKPMKW